MVCERGAGEKVRLGAAVGIGAAWSRCCLHHAPRSRDLILLGWEERQR